MVEFFFVDYDLGINFCYWVCVIIALICFDLGFQLWLLSLSYFEVWKSFLLAIFDEHSFSNKVNQRNIALAILLHFGPNMIYLLM